VGGTISGGAGMGSFRNRIINGDMRIAQRGTSNVVPNGVNNSYGSIDRWRTTATWSAGQLTITRQTLAASDNPYQTGLQYSLRCTVNTGLTGFNYFYVNQVVELLNIIDLNLGTPFGSPFTVSFWFRSNIPAGSTMCAAIQTYISSSISYVTEFKTTGTWQYVTFTVPPMTTAQGVLVSNDFLLAIGSLNTSSGFVTPSSNVNTWASGINSLGSAAMYPWWQNAGNFIEFTGVQLERGTVATPFEVRNYAQELQLCQRYMFQLTYQDTSPCYQRTSVLAMFLVRFPVTMRSAVNPTLSGTFNCSIGATDTTISSISAPGGGYGASATGSQYMFPSTQTLGNAGNIWMNSSGAYIRYDAEL